MILLKNLALRCTVDYLLSTRLLGVIAPAVLKGKASAQVQNIPKCFREIANIGHTHLILPTTLKSLYILCADCISQKDKSQTSTLYAKNSSASTRNKTRVYHPAYVSSSTYNEQTTNALYGREHSTPDHWMHHQLDVVGHRRRMALNRS